MGPSKQDTGVIVSLLALEGTTAVTHIYINPCACNLAEALLHPADCCSSVSLVAHHNMHRTCPVATRGGRKPPKMECRLINCTNKRKRRVPNRASSETYHFYLKEKNILPSNKILEHIYIYSIAWKAGSQKMY